ncbi:hypothetical protein Pan97_53190 [Bremerella volcania]|uniref:DUF1444 family protein n=1 Tax=Bremerella volcania TaxID=2527984 RepID=A0A518CG82_9BACT|nr:DUF1444 family protein [Bremerella volcania]QDU78235.1 hypothetical protein Pan97_53190 [Bremerella volcania]
MDLLRYLFGSSKRDQFAERLMHRVKQAGESREIRYERQAYQFSFYDQGELAGVASLGNIFREYDRLPEREQEAYLCQITRAILSHHKSIPEEFEDARPDILPIVRSRAYLEIGNLERRLRGEQPAEITSTMVGDHLLALPIFDLPEAMRTIDATRMSQWGRSIYELMEVALENLDELTATVTTIDDRVFLFRNQDHYDASRLLLTDRIRRLELQGLPVAMVPTRDCLIVTGDEDEIGLQLMQELVNQYICDPRPISLTPCRLTAEGWETWLPPVGHPQHGVFWELHLQGHSAEYREQHEAIEVGFAQTGQEGFVANYYLHRDLKTRQLHSYCVWPECPHALLPMSDVVVFMDSAHMKPLASGTWEVVQEVLGSQMEDLKTYPPRYRVLGFPDEEALRQIGSIPRFRL